MKLLVLLSGIFIVSTCMAFFIFPSLVEELIKWVGRKRNLNYVVFLRLLSGTILILGANTTRYPTAIFYLGILFIVGALVLLVFPATTIKKLTRSWLDRASWVVRSWVLLPLALGAFILVSVL